MNTLFTFFLLVTLLLIGFITSTQGQVKNTRVHFFLKFKLICNTNANNFIDDVWLLTGCNYLTDTDNSPGWTSISPVFSFKKIN